MQVVVLTPGKEIFSGEIKAVKVPGTSGQFEIQNGHAPIVSSLQEGKVTITTMDGASKVFSIDKGFVEVLNNEVSLLVQGYQE